MIIIVIIGVVIFFVLLNPFSNNKYKIGNTINVSNVADNNPPITTVANGFCTSAPPLVDKAMGKNPNDATAAVINTGLSLVFVPIKTRCNGSDIPSDLSWLK